MNLSGMSSVWDSLMRNAQQPDGSPAMSEQDLALRRKKIMAAGQGDNMGPAAQWLFGNQLNSAGTPRA